VITTASLSPTERFSDLIEGLMKDVAAAVVWGWVPIPLIKLLWRRLRRMNARFASVLARFRARPAAAPPPLDLPRRVGWVVQVISGALVWGYELEKMVDDPELAAMTAGAPQLGRVLRPLCRMMAVRPPAWLRLPRRRRPAPAHARLPARPCFVWAPESYGAVRIRFGGRPRRRRSSTRKFGFERARRWCVHNIPI
jgi:hypothetical protein